MMLFQQKEKYVACSVTSSSDSGFQADFKMSRPEATISYSLFEKEAE